MQELIQRALCQKDHDRLFEIFGQYPELVNKLFSDGKSPLFLALEVDFSAAGMLILIFKADVNQACRLGPDFRSPLEHALWQENCTIDLVNLLISEGASLTVMTSVGLSLYDFARARHCEEKICEALTGIFLKPKAPRTSSSSRFPPEVKIAERALVPIDESVASTSSSIVVASATTTSSVSQTKSFISSYELYWRTCRKIPSDALLKKFNTAKRLESSAVSVTEEEKMAIEGRRLWSNAISLTHKHNRQLEKKTKDSVLKRMQSWYNPAVARQLYDDVIDYLQNGTVLLCGFDLPKVLKKPESFALLNSYESGHWRDGSAYQSVRELTEEGLFLHLPADCRKKLLNNPIARPHYGQLYLADSQDQLITHQTWYGKSLVVFRDALKHNTLFVPTDSLNHFSYEKKSYQPADFHHMGLLLNQMSDQRLQDICHRVKDGKFPAGFSQTAGQGPGAYIEVLLPSVDLLEPGMVEHWHVDTGNAIITRETQNFFADHGITLTNDSKNPYRVLYETLCDALDKNDYVLAKTLITANPALVKLIGVGRVVCPDDEQTMKIIIEQIRKFEKERLSAVSNGASRFFVKINKPRQDEDVFLEQALRVLQAVIREDAEDIDLEEYIEGGAFSKGHLKNLYEGYRASIAQKKH